MLDSFVSVASEQGLRDNNEDGHVITSFETEQFGCLFLFAVTDGHYGWETSNTLIRYLKPEFWNSLNLSEGNIEEALRLTFSALAGRTEQDISGSTLSVLVVSENEEKAYVAVLGDSPVIGIVGGENPLFISPEHNIRRNPEELSRAIERGGEEEIGYIYAKGGRKGLQLSRAFGNCDLGDIISKEPEIFVLDILPESIFILSTDGVWTNHLNRKDEAKEILQKVYKGCTARKLVWEGAKQTRDNATAVIWKRNP